MRKLLAILWISLAVAGTHAADTLRHDLGDPAFAFRFPDVYGDDFRNQWFQSWVDAELQGVLIAFGTEGFANYTTGDPDLVLLIWESGEDSLPVAESILLTDTTRFADIEDNIHDLEDQWEGTSEQFVYVDLLDHDRSFSADETFHVGYTAILNSPDDTLAILSDAGNLETAYASEWYDGEFVPMSDAWRGVNFFIRVLIETASGIEIIGPGAVPSDYDLLSAYPNPFNASSLIEITLAASGNVTLDIFDILGRHMHSLSNESLPAGAHSFPIDAADWTSGTYFVHLRTPGNHQTLKLLLEK